MIEVKVVWSGQGRAATSAKIRADLKKLANCLRGHLTKEAHMILIDGLDVQSTPSLQEGGYSRNARACALKAETGVAIAFVALARF